ncbi:MAG: GGDEF and EAL domain-containing protein [Lachnospiraceae bacterium]|nr:GGDEF and EAL domain-containing protein [Lachnospiraceae bacterium]
MENNSNCSVQPSQSLVPSGLPGGFFIYNAVGDNELLFADYNLIKLFGCETFEELQKFTHNSFKGMVHFDDYKKIDSEIMAQTFNSDKKHDYIRYRIITKTGDIRYVEDFGHLLHGKNGEKIFYVFIVDLDKDEYFNRGRNSFAESQIFAMNKDSDRLTGLLNMASFYEQVQNGLSELTENETKNISFVHFDIVNFKIFNEKYGFQKGDELLCRIAFTIRQEFQHGFFARFSNDHFVVATNAENVEKIVENVHNIMLNIFKGIRVEIKAGIYHMESKSKEVGLACDQARIACNSIKHRYDKIYEIYKENIHKKLRMAQFVIDNIDTAVEKEYLKVFYQPIIRVSSEKICGYEALARWEDPVEGMLSPGSFIPPLEEYHMIHKVDLFVISKVCEDLSRMLDNNEKVVPVSVNLSRIDFELCDVFAFTEQLVTRYNLPRELLEIEITESSLNEDATALHEKVNQFREMGYHIWIDDFGSGYSSLNHLLDYEFDVIKLDLEFLRTYDKHIKAAELIRHIVQGALDMQVEPLQEGVETKEHFEFLKLIGCIRAQGYYFAKPMPLDESREFTKSKGLDWE